MHNLIKELRRRHVFRVAGLYVGVAWIVLEAASVLLPAFNTPEWVFRSLVIIAFIGFPVSVVLAWVFEITEEGVKRQEEAEAAPLPAIAGRQMDFIVIGVLTVALGFSIYMNLRSGPEPEVEREPVSILIADIDNLTADPVFDGTLEQALTIGIEGAPYITSYQRTSAQKLARTIRPDADRLDLSVARLVSVREGIKVVLAGSIAPENSGYFLTIKAVDPPEGETIAEANARAQSKAEVLAAVGSLAGQIREALGDDSLEDGELATSETFTAASLEAAKNYTLGQEVAYLGNIEDAVTYYRNAIEQDPNFGRAYSSWALAEFKLGRTEQATELWQKALSHMDTMTERERLRTLGLYYIRVTRNYEKAIESWESLVQQFPADAAGHSNLAVAYFLTLDFERALVEGKRILDIYPKSTLYRSNYALFSMYAGDYETAEAEARKLVEQDPTAYKGYLPQAIAAVDREDRVGAQEAYERMAQAGPRGASTANIGLADMELFAGRFNEAQTILETGIEEDLANDNPRGAATKYIALAESYLALGDVDAAVDTLSEALELAEGEARVVPAAIIYQLAGQDDAAARIAGTLVSELQPQSRAYGLMITGILSMANGNKIQAIDSLRSAIDLADLWLIRFYLGRAYLEAGYYAEALDEFTALEKRRGEASAVFLDDVPSYRYLADLPYWQARAQEGLGMSTAATKNYQAFLARRPSGGPLADDARQRLP